MHHTYEDCVLGRFLLAGYPHRVGPARCASPVAGTPLPLRAYKHCTYTKHLCSTHTYFQLMPLNALTGPCALRPAYTDPSCLPQSSSSHRPLAFWCVFSRPTTPPLQDATAKAAAVAAGAAAGTFLQLKDGRFIDERWVNGRWDLNRPEFKNAQGEMDWDAVIDAGTLEVLECVDTV